MEETINHEALAKEAVELVKPAIEALFESRAKRKHLHIVILNPRIKPWTPDIEHLSFDRDIILCEYSFGSKDEWEHSYRDIAISKAYQTWQSGQANIITNMLGAATLQPYATVYWGSFEYYGVVVAASGLQPWFDMLVSAWIATAFQHLVQDELQRFREQNPDADFLQ